jgi:hypothetical protein
MAQVTTFFRAYDRQQLMLEVRCRGVAADIEREVFQSRLNRGELSEVVVWTDEPFSKHKTMYRTAGRA